MTYPVAIDFETLPIEAAPHWPPRPVGVAIKYRGHTAHYYGWGHADAGSATWAEAAAALAAAYAYPGGIVGHNLKFDLAVAEAEFGLSPPPWRRLHDTLVMAFLCDPSAPSLGLKPLATALLGEPPAERDAVVDWLIDHQPLLRVGQRLSAKPRGDHYAGAWVSLAPCELVSEYACGDVIRTERLFKLLSAKIRANGMGAAYERECRLLPIILAMQQRGIHVDLDRLRPTLDRLHDAMARVDRWLHRRLKTEANLDSGFELSGALINAGLASAEALGTTATGAVRSDKAAIGAAVTDPVVAAMLRYRAGLATTTRTFLGPWYAMASATGGTIHAEWNQVRGSGERGGGTRTGRLSATWFMNMPKAFSPLWRDQANPELPPCPIRGLEPLPNCRSFIVPGADRAYLDRDYSQQEPRILAHFSGGDLLAQYIADPWTDVHTYVQQKLAGMGLHYARKPVKITNLGLIYGMGVGKLATATGLSVDEAGILKASVLSLYPGLRGMYTEMARRAQRGEPVRTWGGRLYYCEPPRQLPNGHWLKFDYKLVNVLIQGSGADCIKEAITRFVAAADPAWRLELTIHDELVVSAPVRDRDAAMACLRESMESIEFDVPMKSEGAWSQMSWGALEPFDTHGQRV